MKITWWHRMYHLWLMRNVHWDDRYCFYPVCERCGQAL
jgi:hypothetical protein